jgi:hypothetical protein
VTVSPSDKAVAQHVAAAFGGKPQVRKYHDDEHRNLVDVLSSADRPEPGMTSYSTLKLSSFPLYQHGRVYPASVELVGACSTTGERFGNLLASCAFKIIAEKAFCAPGLVFEGLGYANIGPHLPHVLFVPPFLWEGDLKTLRLEDRTVAWLLAVPISQAEMEFADREGAEKLEEVFEREDVDVFDTQRKSAV